MSGLHTFLACAAIVMLAATRHLDYSAYEDAIVYARAGLILEADIAGNLPQKSLCDGILTAEESLYEFGDGSFDGCATDAPAWMDAPDYAEGSLFISLATQHMPIDYRADSYSFYMAAYAVPPLSTGAAIAGEIETPTPPPRTV